MGKNDKSKYKFIRIFIIILVDGVNTWWIWWVFLSFSSLSRLTPRYQRRQVSRVDLTNNAFIAKSRDFSRSLAKWNDAQHYTYSDNSDPSSADQAFSPISSSTSSPPLTPTLPLSSSHRRCAACFAREFHELRFIAFDSSIGEPMASFRSSQLKSWRLKTYAHISGAYV